MDVKHDIIIFNRNLGRGVTSMYVEVFNEVSGHYPIIGVEREYKAPANSNNYT